MNCDLIYNILSYIDDYTIKRKGDRIIIYDPNYKLVLNKLDHLCSITDKLSVKSWRFFNHFCMKILYKNCTYHDFHLLLQHLNLKEITIFMDMETTPLFQPLSLEYYHLLHYIYSSNYPKLNPSDKPIVYGLFWDYCKFYYTLDKNNLLL
jgi:hypothetical protein